jgi:serine/threonine protein kinase
LHVRSKNLRSHAITGPPTHSSFFFFKKKKKKKRRHGISAKSFFDQVLHKNPDVRFDIQQAMTHAFLKTCDGEDQGTEDSIGSLLSKRTSDVVLDEREQKRARQDNQPNEVGEQLVARVISIPTTTIPITTALKSSLTQAKVVHSH